MYCIYHIVDGAGQTTATPSANDLSLTEDIFMDGDELKMYKQMVKISGGSQLGRASTTTIPS